MVSYLALIEQMRTCYSKDGEFQFLVSGEDIKISESVFKKICSQAAIEKKNLIIILDDLEEKKIDFQDIRNMGFEVKNGFGRGYGFSDVLNIRNVNGITRFREILDIMEYTSREKDKLLAYLNLIYYLETLSNEEGIDLTPDILSTYGATMLVERKIQALLEKGVINREQQSYLLSKYMEVSSVGADLESSLYILLPFMSNTAVKVQKNNAYIFSLKDFRCDSAMKKLFFKGLIDSLEGCNTLKTELIIIDGGYGKNNCLVELWTDFPKHCNVHMFTKDIFSVKNVDTILSRFEARIYSRHSNMYSCEVIEYLLGKALISRSSYTETYDNRLKANTPWDVLFGKNRVEAYTTNAPIWESKYPKEMINRFPIGNGIIEFQGQSSVFSI